MNKTSARQNNTNAQADTVLLLSNIVYTRNTETATCFFVYYLN